MGRPFDSGDIPPAGDLETNIRQSRASASPSLVEFKKFRKMIKKSGNEKTLERVFDQRILKALDLDIDEDEDPSYQVALNKQWVDFPANVGFNNNLSAAMPDRVEGFLQSSFPQPVLAALGGSATLVKDTDKHPAQPHFAIEYKRPGQDMLKASTQAGYDGSSMVYGRNTALAYLGQPDPPRFAAVVTATTAGHSWSAFAHYSHKNEATGQLEYFQYELAGGT